MCASRLEAFLSCTAHATANGANAGGLKSWETSLDGIDGFPAKQVEDMRQFSNLAKQGHRRSREKYTTRTLLGTLKDVRKHSVSYAAY